MTTSLSSLLQNIRPIRALVIGDVMLDRYISGATTRVSPEAPVPILQVDQQDMRPGGAACVASFLRGLGAEVSIAGVTGDDYAGHTLRKILADDSIATDLLLTDPSRPTTQKDRFIGRAADRHGQQIVRVDYESTKPISCEFKRPLRYGLQEMIGDIDVVVISDYAKGVCSRLLLESVIPPALEYGIPVLVDPGKGNPLEWYYGATVLKPNRLEAEQLTGRSIDSPRQAQSVADEIRGMVETDAVVVTLDQDGCVVSDGSNQMHLPTQSRGVYDITGAGDMFIAALATGLANGLNVTDGSRLANAAAGLEVERPGTAPVSRVELELTLRVTEGGEQSTPDSLEKVSAAVELARQRGRKVVFTNGCFDLLHVGHVRYLQQAAALGDMLVVAINSDASVRRLKGKHRPVIGETDRASLLQALACIDHVLVFDDDTPHRLLHALKPDVLVKGGTYSVDEVVGREVVEAYGGKVVVTDQVEGISTTAIVDAIREGP